MWVWISLINGLVAVTHFSWLCGSGQAAVLEADFNLIRQNHTTIVDYSVFPFSAPTAPPPPPPAIYLCKRTMQNKARLELADYEAVSPLLSLFLVCKEAITMIMIPFFFFC